LEIFTKTYHQFIIQKIVNKKIFLYFFLTLFFLNDVFAQEKIIKGIITQSGEPSIGAMVYAEGYEEIQTFTDQKGFFKLQLPRMVAQNDKIKCYIVPLGSQLKQVTYLYSDSVKVFKVNLKEVDEDNYFAKLDSIRLANQPKEEPKKTEDETPKTIYEIAKVFEVEPIIPPDSKEPIDKEIPIKSEGGILSDDPNRTSGEEITEDIEKVSEVIEEEQKAMIKRNEIIKNEIVNISTRLKNSRDLTPEQRAKMVEKLEQLQKQLAENAKAFEEVQRQAQAEVDKMKSELSEKESLLERNKTFLFYLFLGLLLSFLLVAIFVYLARRYKRQRDLYLQQKRQIEEQRNEIEQKSQVLKEQQLELRIKNKALVQSQNTLALKNEELELTNDQLDGKNRELDDQKDQLQNQNTRLTTMNDELTTSQEKIKEQNKQIKEQLDELYQRNEEIKASLRYANTIQLSILPERNYINRYLGEHFVIYDGKEPVSGDFYWAKKLGNSVFLTVADCTGHGVPGALMSMIGVDLLNFIVEKQRKTNLDEVLEELHTGVVARLKQMTSENEDGMDLALLKIETLENGNKKVEFAGAKRPLYYVEPDSDELLEIKGTRRAIGGTQNINKVFKVHTLEIPSQTMIYLTSDGYADTPNLERRKFGTRRLMNLLGEISYLDMEEQEERLQDELYAYKKDAEQRDDVTILGLRLK